MLDHLQAIKDRVGDLQPTGWTTYIGRAVAAGPGVSVPQQYVVLETPGWGDPEDLAAAGLSSDLDVDIRVKAVGATTEAVLIMLDRIRADLSPHRRYSPLDVPNRSAWTRYVRSEFVGTDLDHTILGTELHPAFGVDTYHLISEPKDVDL